MKHPLNNSQNNNSLNTVTLGLISFTSVFLLALIIPLNAENNTASETQSSLETKTRRENSFLPPTVEIKNVNELEQLLRVRAPKKQILFARNFPKDFSQISNIDQKKRLFIQTLKPIILSENQRLRELRTYIQEIILLSNNDLPNAFKAKIQQLLKHYKITRSNKTDAEAIDELLDRMDIIPYKLVLAQAAMESGWGTSRFTIEGNSLFGQWTWDKNQGIKPSARDEGATHRVKHFASIQLSVRDYLLNLNTNEAYQELRTMRRILREKNQTYDALQLATGLIRYSQRKEEYVKEIQQMLKSTAFSSA